MFRDRLTTLVLLAGALAVSSCNARGKPVTPDSNRPDPTMDPKKDPDTEGLPPAVASSKARLKFKGGELYAKTLAGGLGLPRDALCRELGLYDCVDDVHRISLLDVEPYRTGILEPLDNTVVSTPIAVERVALSACAERARRDFADLSNAEIFRDIALDDTGGIADLGTTDAALTKLYQRLLQRDPEPGEIEHLKDLYASMAEIGDPSLAETWASTSCFAVATTMEALFY